MARFRCIFGIHDWHDVSYRNPKECEARERCRHCPKRRERVLHSWPDDWVTDVSRDCLRIKVCLRCAEEERNGHEHVWPTTWSPSGDDICLLERACQMCGTTETKEDHDIPLESASRVRPDSCELEVTCRNCTRTFFRTAEHEYVWMYRDEAQLRIRKQAVAMGVKGKAVAAF